MNTITTQGTLVQDAKLLDTAPGGQTPESISQVGFTVVSRGNRISFVYQPDSKEKVEKALGYLKKDRFVLVNAHDPHLAYFTNKEGKQTAYMKAYAHFIYVNPSDESTGLTVS
jgi:hypothetical protein